MSATALQPSRPADPNALDPAMMDQLLDTVVGPVPSRDADSAYAARRSAARLAIQALRPADSFAAMLAAQAIAAHYAIMDAFRRAIDPDLPPAMAARLRANAASLARMMQATLRTLRQHHNQLANPVPQPEEKRSAQRPAKPDRSAAPRPDAARPANIPPHSNKPQASPNPRTPAPSAAQAGDAAAIVHAILAQKQTASSAASILPGHTWHPAPSSAHPVRA